MKTWLIRRALWSLFVVWVVVTAVFALMFALGDPAVATLGARAQQVQITAFRTKHGLDRPLYKQYLSYLGVIACERPSSPAYVPPEETSSRQGCGLLQGDLGTSLQHNESVTDVVLARLPRTVLLSLLAMLVELLLGLAVGVTAASARNTWLDAGLMSVAFVGIALPSFLVGLLALDLFAFRLGWFPVGGYGTGPLEHLQHAVLPAMTLAILGAATYARLMRSEMVETLQAAYLRAAKAKGLAPWRVLFGHAIRNAMLPIVTVAGLQIASLVSGAIITETIFAWPGMGRLAVESMNNWDPPMVLGIVVIASLAVQAGNLLADITVAALDPRIRHA